MTQVANANGVPVGLVGARVLVTGASGFIGSALADRLAAAGVELHCLGRKSPFEVRRKGAARQGVTWWQAELTDRQQTCRAVERIRPDYVFHLASQVTGSREVGMVEPLLNGELAATVHLLEALIETGCKRVVCSGSAEEPNGAVPQARIVSPYAAAKTASRVYQRLFDELYDLPVVNARIAMVYGPGQRDTTKLVPYVTRSLLRASPPGIGNGQRVVDWVYVDDVVDALMQLAIADGARGRAIDIGTGVLTSIRDVVARLHRITGSSAEPRFGAVPPRALEQPLQADAEATRRRIGWSARVGLDEGLRRTVRFYAETEGHPTPMGCRIPPGGQQAAG